MTADNTAAAAASGVARDGAVGDGKPASTGNTATVTGRVSIGNRQAGDNYVVGTDIEDAVATADVAPHSYQIRAGTLDGHVGVQRG